MPLIKYNNQSLSNITALPSAVPTGKLKLISSQTASNSASISFTLGLTSTYKVYKFVFVNIHPSSDGTLLEFNLSTDGGSNYNVTKTTTAFTAWVSESGTGDSLQYRTGLDLAQSTAYQELVSDIGADNDQNACGSLLLFNPSSTTYVKHFISNFQNTHVSDYTMQEFIAGYGNTTSAINAIQFRMLSGNIDSGTIYLYAIDNS